MATVRVVLLPAVSSSTRIQRCPVKVDGIKLDGRGTREYAFADFG